MTPNKRFTFRVMGGHTIQDIYDDNFDIEVRLPNGDRYIATIFTVTNIKSIMARHNESGESANGAFFWASDMIIIRDLRSETISRMIESLMDDGLFELAFKRQYEVGSSSCDG